MKGKDLISIADLESGEIRGLIDSAIMLKQGGRKPLLEGKILALMFEKPSLRTRVSFDVAMGQLGGRAIYLSQAEVGLGQREPIADVARVLGRYVDGIVVLYESFKEIHFDFKKMLKNIEQLHSKPVIIASIQLENSLTNEVVKTADEFDIPLYLNDILGAMRSLKAYHDKKT